MISWERKCKQMRWLVEHEICPCSLRLDLLRLSSRWPWLVVAARKLGGSHCLNLWEVWSLVWDWCLYEMGHLHWIMLVTATSWTTGASSSAYLLKHHAGILSAPVAFLGFKCFRTILIWPMDNRSGGLSSSRCSTAWSPEGTDWILAKA
jgi:hypothetical protein